MKYILADRIISTKMLRIPFGSKYIIANDIIIDLGFENLDFMNNLGHSIETNISKRKYIEKGNTDLLSSVDYFTFEPHIASSNSNWGFKYENIYYFDDSDILCEL